MYIGTVTLGMSEREFWRCSPRKLIALFEVHKRVNGVKEEDKEQKVYIDQIF
jgi:hypothetical protein